MHSQYRCAKLRVMLKRKLKNKMMSTILGRVAREGRCKETHVEAGTEQGVGHADISHSFPL